MHLQENTLFDLDHMNLCSIPSTSHELKKFEVAMSSSLGGGEMYLQENTLFDLGSRSYELLPSTFYIM